MDIVQPTTGFIIIAGDGSYSIPNYKRNYPPSANFLFHVHPIESNFSSYGSSEKDLERFSLSGRIFPFYLNRLAIYGYYLPITNEIRRWNFSIDGETRESRFLHHSNESILKHDP